MTEAAQLLAEPLDVLPPEQTTRSMILGEVVGSFLLSFLGIGIGVSATLWSSPTSKYFADIWPTAAGWALAVALGIYVAASLSGAHFNPAITIALAATGRHPWRLVPLYIGCQLVGWFLGAAALVALFGRNISAYAHAHHLTYGGPGSQQVGSMLTTYSPNPGNPGASGIAAYTNIPFAVGFASEAICTALLVLIVFSLLETRHVNSPSAWFFPLVVGATIGLLIMFCAPLTQASFNPARDLGPRFMLLLMGFGQVAFPGPNHGLALLATVIGPIVGAVAGGLFFDKIMRPNIPGASAEPTLTTLSQLAFDPGTPLAGVKGVLLGHVPSVAPGQFDVVSGIDLILLNVGGTIYDDDCFAQALRRATKELSATYNEADFWQVYDAARQAQRGGLRASIASRFLDAADRPKLGPLTESYLDYTSASLYADVEPTLALLAKYYKLGLVANHGDEVLAALERDGLRKYFSVLATSERVGVEKPNPKMWQWALEQAGVAASAAIHVGNRLDTDIRPARELGLKTVWFLRGDVPMAPTPEQLNEPDAVITTFAGVLGALAGFAAQDESDVQLKPDSFDALAKIEDLTIAHVRPNGTGETPVDL